MLNTIKNYWKTIVSWFDEPQKEQVPTEQPKDFVAPTKVAQPKRPVVKPAPKAQTTSVGKQKKTNKKK